MKARIPIPQKQRKALEVEVRAAVIKEMENQRNAMMRRFFKIMCYALNNKFGFGSKRLNTLIDAISQTALEADTDEIFWEHLDKIVIDSLGMDFERDYTDEMR